MSAYPQQPFDPRPRRRRGQQSVINAYKGRKELSMLDRAVIELVARLSETKGFSFAGQTHMAAELGCHPRTYRRAVARLNAMGIVGITPRRGQTNLLKIVRDPEAEPPHIVPTPPRTNTPTPPGHSCPPRGGHLGPPKDKNNYKLRGAGADAPQQPELPMGGKRLYWRPPDRPITWESPRSRRICEAFKAGCFRYVEYDGRPRIIAEAQWNNQYLLLHLVDEAGDELPTQCIRVLDVETRYLTFWS